MKNIAHSISGRNLSRRGFLALAAGACAACGARPGAGTPAGGYAVSIYPLAALLEPVVGARGPVTAILPTNASPHTYEARPSDAVVTEGARALFYVADDLDGWAVSLPSTERVAVLDLVPEEFYLPWPENHEDDHDHDHADHDHATDPHFWSDPVLIAAMMPALADKLSRFDSDGSSEFSANAAAFVAELEGLHGVIDRKLAPVAGAKVVSFHPSWNYFLTRYGIETVGYIEPSAGKEVTPRALQGLMERAKASGVKAILTEPQLARRPAEVVSEETGIPVVEIDPLGGVPGRDSYLELLLHNANVLAEALA